MAKAVYCGVGGVARKVKKIYVGVDGVARRVKKAYVGVGGVARLFWSGGNAEITKTTIDHCGTVWCGAKAFAIGDSYFAVGGGYTNGAVVVERSTVYFYDNTGTRVGTGTSLGTNMYGTKGACESVGNYGIYCTSSSATYVKAVSTTLTSSNVTVPTKRLEVAARLPGYMVSFGRGHYAINSDLTVTSITNGGFDISSSSWNAAAAGKDYVIGILNYNTLHHYNSDLTYGVLTNSQPFEENCPESKMHTLSHPSGVILMDSGNDTDDGEEYTGKHINFVNTNLTVSVWGTKGSYEYPASRMRLADYAICFGHGQSDNADKWTWCWDDSLTRTQPDYVTYANCGAASSISENWGIVVGGLLRMDGSKRYGSTAMNILTT